MVPKGIVLFLGVIRPLAEPRVEPMSVEELITFQTQVYVRKDMAASLMKMDLPKAFHFQELFLEEFERRIEAGPALELHKQTKGLLRSGNNIACLPEDVRELLRSMKAGHRVHRIHTRVSQGTFVVHRQQLQGQPNASMTLCASVLLDRVQSRGVAGPLDYYYSVDLQWVKAFR